MNKPEIDFLTQFSVPLLPKPLILVELVPAEPIQYSLFPPKSTIKQEAIMQVCDRINRKMGRNTVFFASSGTKREWKGKSSRSSPPYTTSWKHLPMVMAGK
jgi:DNA polymerase V